jgi:hypothetical protein
LGLALRIITDRDNFLAEAAVVVRALWDRGFHHVSLLKVVCRFLNKRFYWYGDGAPGTVYREFFVGFGSTAIVLPICFWGMGHDLENWVGNTSKCPLILAPRHTHHKHTP